MAQSEDPSRNTSDVVISDCIRVEEVSADSRRMRQILKLPIAPVGLLVKRMDETPQNVEKEGIIEEGG